MRSKNRVTLSSSSEPSVCYSVAARSMFFIFSEKRHKIVEIFALLATELSSYKMCKVGILFCIL